MSRELFDINDVDIYVSSSVRNLVSWGDDDHKVLSGAPSGSGVSVDLWGRVISIHAENEKLLLNPFRIAITFDPGGNPYTIFPHKL